jgi:hypothetical protein
MRTLTVPADMRTDKLYEIHANHISGIIASNHSAGMAEQAIELYLKAVGVKETNGKV